MQAIPVSTLQEGAHFTKDVFLHDKYIILSPDSPISPELLARLSAWEFREIYSTGNLTDKPMPTSTQEVAAPAVSIEYDIREKEHLKEVQDIYTSLLDFIEKMFTGFVTKNELPLQPISDKVKSLTEVIKNRRNYILRLAHLEGGEKSYVITHTAKTTILAIAIGMQLKLLSHKIIELGVATMVHELGMIRLPPQLYLGNKVVNETEKKSISAHTILAFKILRTFSYPMPICIAVLEHHERANGSGYPRAVTGDKLSLYSKIIAVCDAFCAAISKRPYREARNGHTALMELVKERNTLFEDQIVMAAVYTLSLYPLGTYVAMADGAKGVVVDADADNPRYPVVRVYEVNGSLLKEPIVIRSAEGEHQIARALLDAEVTTLESKIKS